MNIFIVTYLCLGILSSIYSYGTAFAYFQNKFTTIAKKNYISDRKFSINFVFLSFALPVITPITIFCLSDFNKYGWKIK